MIKWSFSLKCLWVHWETCVLVTNETGDDPYGFYVNVKQKDWEEIKKFIDKQFNLLK